ELGGFPNSRSTSAPGLPEGLLWNLQRRDARAGGGCTPPGGTPAISTRITATGGVSPTNALAALLLPIHVENAGLEERRVLYAGGRANALRRRVLARRQVVGVDRRAGFAVLDFLPRAEQRLIRGDPPTVGVAAVKIRE